MFPKPLTVSVKPYTPTETKFGDRQDAWGAAQDVQVYGFADSGADQEIRPTRSGLKIDGDLYTDEWAFSPKSKVTVAGVEYLQLGRPENYNLGPFGFRPGLRINLHNTEG